MISTSFDVIVIGAGLMGASTAAALVKSGKTVLVFDSHPKFHELGSSHGHARIIRSLASEAKIFPQTAKASWRAIEAMESAQGSLIQKMPAVFIVKADSRAHKDLKEEVRERKTPLDVRTGEQIVSDYGWHMASDELAFIDSDAGVFDPAGVLAHLYNAIEAASGERWQLREACLISGGVSMSSHAISS
jgi:sarcosine oxidase